MVRKNALAIAAMATPRVVTLPISLGQLGETLGMAIATVNRSLQTLRASQALEFRDGELIVKDWRQLQRLGEFDPNYLQSKRIP
jgi:hypothetical protein